MCSWNTLSKIVTFLLRVVCRVTDHSVVTMWWQLMSDKAFVGSDIKYKWLIGSTQLGWLDLKAKVNFDTLQITTWPSAQHRLLSLLLFEENRRLVHGYLLRAGACVLCLKTRSLLCLPITMLCFREIIEAFLRHALRQNRV